MPRPKTNPGKTLLRTVGGMTYARWPIRTRVITAEDNLYDLVKQYAAPFLKPRDLLAISERIVAITQGRAFPVESIRPSKLATFLSRFVHKTPAGIGVGSPWTMELALREVGVGRILLAVAVAALTKPIGIRGMFYRVAGSKVRTIDGPCDYTLPPYNAYAVLGPRDPDRVARSIKRRFKCDTIIIDANDLGVNILGASRPSLKDKGVAELFADNPLGQSREQTPFGIVRLVEDET